SPDDGFKPSEDDENKVTKEPGKEGGGPNKEDEIDDQEKDADMNITNNDYTISSPVNTVGSSFVNADDSTLVNVVDLPDDPNMHALEEIGRFSDAENDDSGADINNLD
ncbi:hypothetical protein Tco_0498339, partial [Tanacetum coccineum]